MPVNLSPLGGAASQFFDNNGLILSGGKVYTYAAGTTTPQATYTSALGTTPHANPIILDSAGRVPGGEIWLTDGSEYKFKIDTATDILIGTYDNITGINDINVNAADVVYDPPFAGAIPTTVENKLAQSFSVTDLGAVGDYNFGTQTGTDNTAAFQNALNIMTASGDNSPSCLIIPAGYYMITGTLTFPTSWARNKIVSEGAIIIYRGPISSSAAIFRFNATGYVKNVFEGLLELRCEERCGYGIDVNNPSADMVFSENTFHDIEIIRPILYAVRIGNQSVSGHDVDGASNSFYDYRHRLETGGSGVIVDAPNNFNIEFFNPFFGGWSSSAPGVHFHLKQAAGIYLHGIFTGDNAAGVPAVLANDANLQITGWNTEGTFLFKSENFLGTRRNILIQNVLVNDSVSSPTATVAMDIRQGEVTLTNAYLGKDDVHPRYIRCDDTLTATNVFLGQNTTTGAYGGYELAQPERCIIEGKRPIDVDTAGANPCFHLWWGSAANDLPIGYEKSALGTTTITRSTSNVLVPARLDGTLPSYKLSEYSCHIAVAAGAAPSGQLVDGLIRRTPITVNTRNGTNGFVSVIRGRAINLVGTTTLSVRLTYFDLFANPLNGNAVTVTPDANGYFTAFITANPADATVVEIVQNIGLGVAGASGDIYVQSMDLLPMTGWSINGIPNWPCFVDAWVKYPRGLRAIDEYSKASIDAKWYAPGAYFIRRWLAAAIPTTGTYVRGDEVKYVAPSSGSPPGAVCVIGGTPGTWSAMANLA